MPFPKETFVAFRDSNTRGVQALTMCGRLASQHGTHLNHWATCWIWGLNKAVAHDLHRVCLLLRPPSRTDLNNEVGEMRCCVLVLCALRSNA